jgi:large subunit ribosomal protein L31
MGPLAAEAGATPRTLQCAVCCFWKVRDGGVAWLPTHTRGTPMKEGIHPAYREVCFVDLSNGFKFVTRSCLQTKESIKMDDGRELPLMKLESTSESHPFYTGTQKSVDNLGGRVEKFRNKFARVGIKK